jgi:hypothetical protein
LIRDHLASFRGAAMPPPALAVPKTCAVTRWIRTGAPLPPAAKIGICRNALTASQPT